MKDYFTKPLISAINDFVDFRLKKIHLQKYREQISYIIIGGGTTVVDWLCFLILVLMVPPLKFQGLHLLSPNILAYSIAWFAAVVFAYVFSRVFVFNCSTKATLKEFFFFVFSRLFTLMISIAGDIVFCGNFAVLKVQNVFVVKVIISVVIIVLNYVFSKFLVFKPPLGNGC